MQKCTFEMYVDNDYPDELEHLDNLIRTLSILFYNYWVLQNIMTYNGSEQTV